MDPFWGFTLKQSSEFLFSNRLIHLNLTHSYWLKISFQMFSVYACNYLLFIKLIYCLFHTKVLTYAKLITFFLFNEHTYSKFTRITFLVCLIVLLELTICLVKGISSKPSGNLIVAPKIETSNFGYLLTL